MFLKVSKTNRLVAVEDLGALFNPYQSTLKARLQWGEEEQDPEMFNKEELCFPSGENLPRCWIDEHYRDEEVDKHRATRGNYGI